MKDGWRRGGIALVIACGLLLGGGCERNEEGGAGPADENEVPVVGPEAPQGEVEPATATPAQETEQEPEIGSAPDAVPESKPEVTPSAPKKPWTRADAGFAVHLPADVEFYADTRRLNWLWEWMGKTGAMEELKGFLTRQDEKGLIPEELGAAMEQGSKIVPLLLGDEAFVAARGLVWSVEAGVGINQWMNRSTGEVLTKGLASGDFQGMLQNETFSMSLADGAVQWLQESLDEVGGDPRVAIYTGGRVEEEKRAEVLGWIRKLLSKAAAESEKLEGIEFEEGGVSWSGFEIGIHRFEGFDPDEGAPKGMDPEAWGKMLAKIGSWSLVVACAEVDDYVVVAAGNGKGSIVLAEAQETSLASKEGFTFFESYDVNSLFGTMWASKGLVEAIHAGSSNLPFFEGVEKGLRKSPHLKRGAAMIKAIEVFNENWKARRAGVAYEWAGAVFRADGLQAETRGGWDAAGLDLKAPLKFAKAFAGLEKAPFIRAHWKHKAEHIARGDKQVLAGLNFLKLVGDETMDHFEESAENDGEDELAEKFRRWKRDLSKGLEDMASGYRDHFSKAFGEEAAFVMDLRGAMIPAVGVDEALLKNGRIPRAALVRPVVKREALGEAWEIWNGAATNLFGIMAEGVNQPIPFPDTMTAEKDDLRTYFFPFPFATDDFLPSVSVSDDLFILGSSKTLSEKLYVSSLNPKGDALPAGMWVEVRTEGLWDFLEAWLGVYEKRRAAEEEIEEDNLPGERVAPEEPAADAADVQKELDEILERAKELREAGETEIPPELREAVEALEVPAEAKEAAEKLEELKNSLRAPAESEVPVPVVPDEPTIPEAEVENPLLKELRGEGEEAGDGEGTGIEIEPAFPRELTPLDIPADEAEEVLPPAEGIDAGDAAPSAGLGILDFPAPEKLRSVLEKGRMLKGLRYRRWSEDGVPRSALRVEWTER